MADGEIEIEHIATGRKVKLLGFGLSEYADTLDASWNSVDVYGRMDPIMTYQGTKREISVGLKWDGLSPGESEIFQEQITKLMTFQYPTYAEENNALAIQSPPLVRVTFANFIGKDATTGLLCAMKGLAFTPGVGFTPQDSPYVRWGGQNSQGTSIAATNISLKLNLTVLHEESLGWHFRSDLQRYDFGLPAGDIFGPDTVNSDWSVDPETVGENVSAKVTFK